MPERNLECHFALFFFSAGFKRPVVLFGPIADAAIEKLSSDLPNEFLVASKYCTFLLGQSCSNETVVHGNSPSSSLQGFCFFPPQFFRVQLSFALFTQLFG